nr:MAG TPA: Prefoldin subunit 1, Prefoldin subunit/CCT, PFD, CryoEM, Molecular Chaperone.8A [Caudoviricetes sp.]
MVQRYEVNAWGLPEPEMAEYAYGDYVEYDSYKELDDYYQERLADAEEEIERLVSRLAEVNAELQKYKDQFPDYVECANCGLVTYVGGVE